MPYEMPKKQEQKVGVEFKQAAGEIAEFIAQLQEMQRYASQHGFKETAKHLGEVIKAVSRLQADNIEPSAVSGHVEEVKKSIIRAKASDGVRVESEQLFSLLRASKSSSFQVVFEHMRNFFDRRNKLEIFLEDKLKIMLGKNIAKNHSLFFNHSTTAVASSPGVVLPLKKQLGKP